MSDAGRRFPAKPQHAKRQLGFPRRLKVGDAGVERRGVSSGDERLEAVPVLVAAPPRRPLARLALRAFAGGLLLSVGVGIAVFVWGDAVVVPYLAGEWLLLAVIVSTVALVLHECSHALVAALLDFRVVEIRLGSGPRLTRRQVGPTVIDVRLVPSFGYVRPVPRSGAHLRTRWVAVLLAGPIATLITTLAFVAFAPGPWKFAAFVVAAMTIPANLVPREHSREGRRWRNDGLLLLDVLRRRDPPRREWTIECESERLILRPLELGDLDAFLASIDDEVLRREGFTPDTLDQYRIGFAQFVNQSCQHWPCNLAVRDRETSEFLGCYELYDFAPAGTSAHLGWWLGAKARGRGLGFESLTLALHYAHTNVGIHRIIMGTTRDNERAVAQIERAGGRFTHEAPHTLPNGETIPAVWFEHAGSDPRQREWG
jgi:RimJ/RimL family protein N-acetyltransferase